MKNITILITRAFTLMVVILLASNGWSFQTSSDSTISGKLTVAGIEGDAVSDTISGAGDNKIPTTKAVVDYAKLRIMHLGVKNEIDTDVGVNERIDKCEEKNGYLASVGELVNIYRNKDTFPLDDTVVNWPTDVAMGNVVSATPASTTNNWGVDFNSNGEVYNTADSATTTDGYICLGPIYYKISS